MMQNLYFLFSLCVLCSCKKELPTTDSDGVVIRRPHIWTVPTSDDGQMSATNFVTTEVSYDNDILIGARKNSQKAARMLSLSNGSTKWEWSDFIEQRDYFEIKAPRFQNGDLVWQADYWNYRIDLSNGKTQWKNTYTQHNGTFALDLS